MAPSASVGVVIPTLNEASSLPGILGDLEQVELDLDIVVADGGSTDRTPAVAAERGTRLVRAARGRGRQLNAGAAQVATPWLCFLHADVRMPASARRAFRRAITDEVDAAVWALAIDAAETWARIMESGARLRDRVGGLPYGDQGLLVRRELFDAVGGYPDTPIMEDVGLVRALARRVPIRRLNAALSVSPRRWQREGPYRTWIRNGFLLTAYTVGIPPERLVRWYRPEPE
jgi:rSAM/selenodomain-associated transferase 2